MYVCKYVGVQYVNVSIKKTLHKEALKWENYKRLNDDNLIVICCNKLFQTIKCFVMQKKSVSTTEHTYVCARA